MTAYVARKARNVLRRMLQQYGTSDLKKRLWNREFARGRWDCPERRPGDCVYPYVEKYARGGSILDLGCGSGNTGSELDATTYRHYTGVDISTVAIENARRRTEGKSAPDRSRYVQSDIFSYVPTQPYDVILFQDSIYYVPWRKITAMLDRYSKYLNEGGVFIVRMWDESDKYRSVLDIIESAFEVVEKHLAEGPKAVVLIFRQRA